ncbi:MAG TPA: portal protein [Sedimentisphaerales bacterium]|nr:portal protein [Sedimentisphaerales bacterium]
MEEEGPSARYRRRLKALQDEVANEGWRSHWKELQDYFLPRKGRYLTDDTSDHNDGGKRNSKIINGVACDVLRILSAGMQGGVTSPSRPWFRLAILDPRKAQDEQVKAWLHDSRQVLLDVFQRSNFYGTTHTGYGELATFGTFCMLIEEDFQNVIRCRPFTSGEYFLGLDSTYRPDSLYRKFVMTVRQMIQEFGEDKVSDRVKKFFTEKRLDELIDVIHVIEPSDLTDPSRKDQKYDSVYFEEKETVSLLRKSGYRMCPFVAPRWDVTSTDTWGRGPGMDALGDVKMLQKMEEKKLKALDKMVDPPMNAPTAMRRQGVTIVPGGVNYIDGMGAESMRGVTPAFQIQPDFQNIAYEIDRVEQRVRRFFFNDLFLTILTKDKTMTATEVAERHEEKLLVLGPVLERLQGEMLNQIIERTFDIVLNLGLLPPPPEQLQGAALKVEYIGLLSQAQKLVGVQGIQQVVGFAAQLAAADGGAALEKLNLDVAMEEIADMHGVNPRVVRSDDEVAAMRQQRQQQQAAMTAMQTAAAGAKVTKDLSASPMGQGTALDMMNEQMGGQK